MHREENMKNAAATICFSILAMFASSSALLLTGCGGDEDDSPPATVAGKWQGTRTLEGAGPDSATLTLAQNGDSANGTWDGVAVGGTVSGNSLVLSGFKTQNGISMHHKLELSISGETMTGTETMGIGNVGSEPYWLSQKATVSLARVAE